MFRLIASYPKSGNTYVRIFLAHYLRGNTDLNTVGFPVFKSKAFFPLADPHRRVPHFPGDIYSKTHEIAAQYSARYVDRAIYIVRNPVDVVPSYARHMAISNDAAIRALGNLGNHLKGTEKIYPQKIGSWTSNVKGWLKERRFPVLVLRYETLSGSPAHGFALILQFLQVPIVETKFQASLTFTEFQRLKELEEKKPFKEARGSTGKFFNVGRAGNGKEVLTPLQLQRIMADHGPTMKLLKYGI